MLSQRTWLLYLVFTLIAVGVQWRKSEATITQLKGAVTKQQAQLAQREAQLNAQVTAATARLEKADDLLARAKTILSEAESSLSESESSLRRIQELNETGQRSLAEVSRLVTSIGREAVVRTASRSALRVQVLECDLRVALANFANRRPPAP